MSQAPALPMFVDAMLADTLHCDCELFGAYHFILYATWRANGKPLADEDEVLARICRMSMARWRKLRPVLVEFFNVTDGTWRQKRLEKEWVYVQERAGRARQNGMSGGRPTKPRDNPAGSSPDTERGTQTESTLTQPQSQEERDESAKALSRRALVKQIGDDFEEWWQHVPTKRSKGQAEKAYRSARKRADSITLLAGIDRFTESVAHKIGADRQFIKHPATWLNGACWLDELELPPLGDSPNGRSHETPAEQSSGVVDRVLRLHGERRSPGVDGDPRGDGDPVLPPLQGVG